jgi:hypothetical protein
MDVRGLVAGNVLQACAVGSLENKPSQPTKLYLKTKLIFFAAKTTGVSPIKCPAAKKLGKAPIALWLAVCALNDKYSSFI